MNIKCSWSKTHAKLDIRRTKIKPEDFQPRLFPLYSGTSYQLRTSSLPLLFYSSMRNTGHMWNSKEAGRRWKGKKPGSLLLLYWYVALTLSLTIIKLKVAVWCVWEGWGAKAGVGTQSRGSLPGDRFQFLSSYLQDLASSFIYSFNINPLMNTYYVPGTITATGGVTVSETENSYCLKDYILVGVKQRSW